MHNMPEKVCLVIPCYNEVQRLDFNEFVRGGENFYLVFVNDGSKDATGEILEKNARKNMYVLNLRSNVGKAEAVRQGVLYLKTLPIFDEIRWFGYWDADLATPFSEIEEFFLYAKTFYPDTEAIFGSRIKRLESEIKRNFKRHLFGRLFASVTGLIFQLDMYDSQCGAKLFKKELLDKCFAEPFISKWIFDVEIILRMKQQKIVEYPLKEWEDKTGGHLRVCSVAVQTVIDLVKLRNKYLNKR